MRPYTALKRMYLCPSHHSTRIAHALSINRKVYLVSPGTENKDSIVACSKSLSGQTNLWYHSTNAWVTHYNHTLILTACKYSTSYVLSESHHVTSDIIRVTKSGTPSCRPQIGTHTTATNTAPSNFDAHNTTNRYIILSKRLTTTNNQQQMGTASPSTQIVVITRPASTHCASTLLRITIDTLDLQRQAEKRCSLVSAYHELRLGPHAFMLHGKTNQSMSKQHHRRGKAYHIMHTLL